MANSKEYLIDLEDFRAQSAKIKSMVFTGRDRGIDIRNRSRLDEIASQYEKVIIIIPSDIMSINPSFFEELFRNVVTKLGKDGFEDKFEIRCDGDYNYQRPLSEAIQRILKDDSAIG